MNNTVFMSMKIMLKVSLLLLFYNMSAAFCLAQTKDDALHLFDSYAGIYRNSSGDFISIAKSESLTV